LWVKVVFSFIAVGLAAILGTGAVLMGLFSAMTEPFNAEASAHAGTFAWAFLGFAVFLGLVGLLLKER